MKVEDLVQELAPYGLEASQGTIYFHLSQAGPTKASDVAKLAGVRRPEVYPILDALEKRGFVERTVEKPARYVAVPVERALGLAIEARARDVEKLRDTHAGLVARWPRPAAGVIPTGSRLAIAQGRTQIQAVVARMLREAQEEVFLVVGRRGVHKLGLTKNPAVGKGVRIRVLTSVVARDSQDWTRLKGLVEIRHADVPSTFQALIIDNRELALFVGGGDGGPGGEDAALWAASSDLAMAHRGLLDVFWARGTPIEARLSELRGGPRASQVTVLRGRWVRVDRLRKMLQSCRSAFHATAPRSEFERWEAGSLWGEVLRLKAAGVDVRLESDAVVRGVPADVAVGLDSGTHRTSRFEVDGSQVLVVAGASAEPESRTTEEEWSVYSTHPDFLSDLRANGLPVQRRPKAKA